MTPDICRYCESDIVWVDGIRHPVNADPTPYSDGVIGWALSLSKGWVRSDLQVSPPREHLVDHHYVCGGAYEMKLMRQVQRVGDGSRIRRAG